MQVAIKRTTYVKQNGNIEIADTQLPVGKAVEVIVLFTPHSAEDKPSVLDVLAQAPGHLAFQSAAEVDAYLQQERQEWER